MKVISVKFPGLTIVCSGCKALLAYKITDVYGDVVYCPICKKPTKVPLKKEENSKEKLT